MDHLGWLDVVGDKEFGIGVIEHPIVGTFWIYGFFGAFDFALDIRVDSA